MLEIGTKAMDFTLPDEMGNEVSLHDFLGKKVILYFYPKDNTPGCTREACAFKSAYDAFKQNNVVVIGISKDTQKAHQNFKAKYELPFLLLSDVEHKVIEAYDVWKEKKLYGKTYMGITRSTYVIDEEGTIIKSYEKASPDKNAGEILEYLHQLQSRQVTYLSYFCIVKTPCYTRGSKKALAIKKGTKK